MSSTSVIFIHGITEKSSLRQEGFSGPLEHATREHVSRRGGRRSPVFYDEFVYADRMDLPGEISAEMVLDVPAYVGFLGSEIREDLERFVLRVAPTAGHVILVGHSLGGVVALDTITCTRLLRRHSGVFSLLTLGAPIGLDVPGLPGRAFADRPIGMHGATRKLWRWWDVRAKHDMIAWGLPDLEPFGAVKPGNPPLDEQPRFAGVRSLTIDSSSCPLAAHDAYLYSDAVASLLAGCVLGGLHRREGEGEGEGGAPTGDLDHAGGSFYPASEDASELLRTAGYTFARITSPEIDSEPTELMQDYLDRARAVANSASVQDILAIYLEVNGFSRATARGLYRRGLAVLVCEGAVTPTLDDFDHVAPVELWAALSEEE